MPASLETVTGRAVVGFVAQGIWGDGRAFDDSAKAIGFAAAGRIVAGVVYHNWQPHEGVIELSAYADRRDWLTKSRLALIFGYPFDQLGVRLCVSRQSERNARPVRIWKALGASLHRLPDMRGDGEAEIVAILRKQDFTTRFGARHGETSPADPC